MGAQVSTNVAKEVSETISNSWQSCGEKTGKTISNTADLSQVVFKQPADGEYCPPGSGFNINQGASVDASCILSNLQNNLAKTVAKLNTEVKGGIGFGASTSVSDIKNKIETNSDQECAGKSASNDASISDTHITACNMSIVQDAKVKEACQINNTQKQANNIIANAKTSTTGFFGGTFGLIAIVIIAIVVVVLVIIIGYFIYKFSSENPQVVSQAATAAALGGAGTNWNYGIIIIAIIILIFILIWFWNRKSKKITQNAINKLEQSLQDADAYLKKYEPQTKKIQDPYQYYPQIIQNEEECLDDYYKPMYP